MNAEQQALLAKARRSIAAARRLAAEGDLDFAASRAYYAMFYTAQAFLLERNLRFSKHSAVIAAFGQEFAKGDDVLREYHRGLIDAEDDRNSGDYEVGVDLAAEDIQTHLNRAEQFVQIAEQRL